MRKQATLLAAILLALFPALSSAQSPVPFIALPLVPDAATPGGVHFILTVNGTGFVSNSVVHWNSTALTTKFVSSSQLTAVVPATNIATARTANITVVNPAPGGGTSNGAFFSVNGATSAGFTLVSTWAVGVTPSFVVVGDFNGDGKLDLATANGDGTVSILLGDGTGRFASASSPVVGSNPISLAVGDFNKDGKLDLATSSGEILLGDGTGNFTVASSFAFGGYSLAAGDFNGDGKLDLAVTSGDGVSILLGDGTGNFTLASSPVTGGWPASVAVGDFNGDDKLDLAVADGDTSVFILLGDGTGNFTVASSEFSGVIPISLAIGDFDGDGNLDVASLNWCGELEGDDCNPGTFTILLGDGTGNIGGGSFYVGPNRGAYRPDSIAEGDFNADGKLDLAFADCGDVWNCPQGSVAIQVGDGKGGFTWGSSLAVSGQTNYANSVAVGDFNGDGKLDLVTANGNNPGTVAILLWDPRAVTFSPTNLTFGTQLIGTASATQAVTMTNIGSQKLHISSVAAGANFSQTNNCGTSLKASASCTITVTFQPVGTGTLTGAIMITDNAANGAQTVSLTGVGTAVTLQPTSVAFGTQKAGTTSPPQTVTLTNYNSKALNVQSMHITGTDPLNFAQTNNCGSSVPAGGTCTIKLTFTPKDLGKKMAKLYVADDGGASPQKVSLTGTGN